MQRVVLDYDEDSDTMYLHVDTEGLVVVQCDDSIPHWRRATVPLDHISVCKLRAIYSHEVTITSVYRPIHVVPGDDATRFYTGWVSVRDIGADTINVLFVWDAGQYDACDQDEEDHQCAIVRLNEGSRVTIELNVPPLWSEYAYMLVTACLRDIWV